MKSLESINFKSIHLIFLKLQQTISKPSIYSLLLCGCLFHSTASIAIEVGISCSNVDEFDTCNQIIPEQEVAAFNYLLKLAGDIDSCRETSSGDGFTCSSSSTGEVIDCSLDGTTATCNLPDGTLATCNEVGDNGAACTINLPDTDTVATNFNEFINGRVQSSFLSSLSKVCTERTASSALQRDCSNLLSLINDGNPLAGEMLAQISPTAALAGNMSLFSQAAQTRNVQDRLDALRKNEEEEEEEEEKTSQVDHKNNKQNNKNKNKSSYSRREQQNNHQRKVLNIASKYLYAFNHMSNHLNNSNSTYQDTQPVSEIQLAALDAKPENTTTSTSISDVSASEFSRLGSFINTISINTEKDSTTTQVGTDVNLTGFTAGIDYRFNSRVIMGLALGIHQADGDLLENRGAVDTTGFALTYYGTYYWPAQVYVDLTLNYGGTDFEQARRIQYSGSGTNVDQIASADYFGSQTQFVLTGGYEWETGAWLINPYAQWQSIDVEIDNYQEEMSQPTAAGSGWALAIDNQRLEANNFRIGAQASFAISRPWGVITPIIRLELVHELEDEPRLIAGRFAGDRFGNNSFEVAAGKLDASYIYSGLGVTSIHQGGFSTFLFVQTLSGYNNVSQLETNLGARWTF